jgi:hypothetical protein
MDFPATPAAFVVQQKTPFNVAGCPAGAVWAAGGNGFCWIGWQPEGDTYYGYELQAGLGGAVVAVDPALAAVANQFYATAVTDIDGDGAQNSWGINQPDIQGNPAVSGAWTQGPLPAICGASALGGGGATGPVDSGTGAGVLGQVGPCDSERHGPQRVLDRRGPSGP